MGRAWLIDVGRMAYAEAWSLQRAVAEQVRAQTVPDVVLLVEHPPDRKSVV